MKAWTVAIHRGVDVRVIVPKIKPLGGGCGARKLFAGYPKGGGDGFVSSRRYDARQGNDHRSGMAVAGSANMDPRSLFFNYEAVCFLYSQGGLLGLKPISPP